MPGLHILAAAREAGVAPLDLVWFTSGRSVEDRVLATLAERAGDVPWERVVLPIEPPGGGAPSRLRLATQLPASYLTSVRALRRHRPEVLIGLGGFTSLPAVLAARRLGIPVALLEINAHAGTATKWLARFATRVVHAWQGTMPATPKARDVHVGPPLAPDFVPDPHGAAAARAALGFDPQRPLLVVLGGSQGSSALNTFVRTHGPPWRPKGCKSCTKPAPRSSTKVRLPLLATGRVSMSILCVLHWLQQPWCCAVVEPRPWPKSQPCECRPLWRRTRTTRTVIKSATHAS